MVSLDSSWMSLSLAVHSSLRMASMGLSYSAWSCQSYGINSLTHTYTGMAMLKGSNTLDSSFKPMSGVSGLSAVPIIFGISNNLYVAVFRCRPRVLVNEELLATPSSCIFLYRALHLDANTLKLNPTLLIIDHTSWKHWIACNSLSHQKQCYPHTNWFVCCETVLYHAVASSCAVLQTIVS